MPNLPLHPALVHLPLALALVVPLLAAVVIVAVWLGWLDRRAWAIVVGLQLCQLGGALVALQTGHEEGERYEDVAKAAVEAHEEAATVFTVASGVTLALAAAGLLIRRKEALMALAAATVAAGGVTASLALRAGHAGGELVFVHGLGGSRGPAVGEREMDAD